MTQKWYETEGEEKYLEIICTGQLYPPNYDRQQTTSNIYEKDVCFVARFGGLRNFHLSRSVCTTPSRQTPRVSSDPVKSKADINSNFFLSEGKLSLLNVKQQALPREADDFFGFFLTDYRYGS